MKSLSYILILLAALCLTACGINDSPPLGPTSLNVTLMIEDKEGVDLLAEKLLREGGYILTSSYKLTAICNEKTIELKDLRYIGSFGLIISVDLHKFDYMQMEGYDGVVTFKLQLPTVFDDNREIVIDAKWRVQKKTELALIADVVEVYLDGVRVESPHITLTVD